ncbi:MAG: AAA family ATPase [Candidatus Sericytochromatia bacterium]|nr:AAA family ATPase [Candidatus Sericytochromatia bacterium]
MTVLLANRYQVLEPLGGGAMGNVSRVLDLLTGQEAALKLIAPKFRQSEKSVLQFKQEFRLMTQLRHPHCCAVYDYGVTPDGEPYFTMEYVPGRGLHEQLPLSEARVVAVLTELLAALSYIHQLGFVHLDVKSENVRVRPDGSVKLMDYGLMDFARPPGGFVNGTLAYLAPEVIRRGAIDQRTDLYSVGVLAYELLTGQLPFASEVPREMLRAHIEDIPEPPSIRRPEISPAMDRLVLRLLAKNPLDRFQSAQQVLEALGADVVERVGARLLSSPLIGREQEMRLLEGQLEALLRARRGGGVLVAGAPGIGKSRLLQEFRFKVQLADLLSVTGRSFERGSAPYEPWVMALRQLLPTIQRELPGVLAAYAPLLVQLLPELGGAPAPALDSPTKEKLRTQATITELLACLAAQQPLVLVLEDWQWADALSRELLDYILRNIPNEPLLLIMSSREVPAFEPPDLTLLPVSALSREAARRMITAMLGTIEVAPAFVDTVARLAKGSPFFIERLLEHLVQSGTLQFVRGNWNTQLDLAAEELPDGVAGLLAWRIRGLSPEAQQVAFAGAIIGRAFSLDLLREVAGLDDEELFAAVASLARAQVLVESEEGGYAFSQDLINELLVSELPPAQKLALHTRVAEALEASVGGTWRELIASRVWALEIPLDQVTALAHHSLAGERGPAAVAWALEAGERHAALFANVQAQHFLAACLQLIEAESGAEGVSGARLRALQALGDVYRVMGRNDQAKLAYTEALALAEAAQDRRLQGYLLNWLGRCHQVLGNLSAALDCVRRARSVADEVNDEAGATRALTLAARIAYFQGDIQLACESAEQALQRARRGGFTGQEGEALGMLGYFYVASAPSRVTQGIAYLEQSESCLAELGDWIALNTTLNFLGTAQNLLTDHRAAQRTFTRNRQICFEIGASDELAIACLNLAITAYELGEFSEMERHAAEAKAVSATLNSRYTKGMAICLHAVARMHAGRLERVERELDEALTIARDLQHRYMEAQVLLYRVRAQCHLGQFEAAEATAGTLLAHMEETGDREPESRVCAFLAELAARRGDFEQAARYLARADELKQVRPGRGLEVALLATGALVAWLADDPREAAAKARAGLALACDIGTRYHEAVLRTVLGELALAEGQANQATVQFEAVAEVARAIGSPVVEAIAAFGQARAHPTVQAASALISRARALLWEQVAVLEEPARQAFFHHRERQRVLDGSGVARDTLERPH